ncbi:RNA polymerase III transcription factor subunit, putative [Penicillium digitatum]|uniref:RNA polymerase III transcription factor subunit, putative n=3 Tax=Penicillium digitatum TaxID=36651 RepID=K9G7R2_PEND2|nr:RNA polymerase III transcription factor subunit, putative [Penicillium digitatum Pd1]EKV10848.1 RNA polymerase III transcription factor subunit, putative [Penicillium digitatum PHI26]EKV13365.1 RNA polymerase III transcription factor subunit, putative [Penicillium digitatum Pd1]QQK43573.1 RNA polymerase III transcription factor subunit, putative [Penicillium digitatum]
MDDKRGPRTAPFYMVPSRRLVSVEHPAVVRNVDKAIDTLQGNAGIKTILNPAQEGTLANLVLRPEDAMARSVQSTSMQSNNVLLKVTVPKRTGRRRKRGSNEPFANVPESNTSGPPPRRTAKDLLRSLSDNPSKYQIEPVGRVERTHVFRGIPDFVYSTTASTFTNRFRDQILPFDFDKMKQFDIDMTKGASGNADLIPPPSFSHGDVPFHYIYRQNPTVKQAIGRSGKLETVNTQTANKVLTHLVPYDIPKVPSEPRPDMLPISALDAGMLRTIATLNALYEKQPAWTRRGLRNNLTTDEERLNLRHAIPYVGYIFRSGPWRDAIIKLGVDPRTSPEYRHYQTFMFRLLAREAELARDGGGGRRHNVPRPSDQRVGEDENASGPSTGHIFTGKQPFAQDGRIWMVGEIQDAQLRAELYPPEAGPGFLRSECDIVTDGWFGNGTLAKAKTVMRHKIQALMEGREPIDADYTKILRLPAHARSEADFPLFTLDPDVATQKEISLATEVRAVIRGSPVWRNLSANAGLVRKEAGEGRGKVKGKQALKGKGVEPEPEPEPEPEKGDEESEGEEEEIQRREMLAAQVADAAAARDADEADEADDDDEDDGDGDDSDDMDEDEDE